MADLIVVVGAAGTQGGAVFGGCGARNGALTGDVLQPPEAERPVLRTVLDVADHERVML